ncbi:MAG: restriction endonuclease, partial [Clostridia bacterium]|nr:restriction endonuclease [Clostridia bacterium]
LTQEAFIQSLSDEYTAQESITIDDVDMMTGTEFEAFIKQYFERLGYTAAVTKASGDQGIDVIAEKRGIKTGIQAKCWSGAVGNAAVQEAVAGKSFYQCDKVMVITNRYFTDSAIQLAKANDVILWDRDILKEKL